MDSNWFEDQYSTPGSDYARLYLGKPHPKTMQEYLYHTGRMLSLCQLPPGSGVFEVGAGSGFTMVAMSMRGYEPFGVEISKTAVEYAHPALKDRIIIGDAREVLMGSVVKYPLIYSNGTLEHIPEADLPDLARNMARMSTYQAHVLATEVGNDPSHVTIHPPGWWAERFREWLGEEWVSIAISDYLYPNLPILYVFPMNDVPYPILVAVSRIDKSNGGAK